MTDKIIVNCSTGEREVRPLSTEEQSQAEAAAQAWLAEEQSRADAAAQAAADLKAWRDAVAAASSIADLKAVLLGSNTPVAPVVDRKPR